MTCHRIFQDRQECITVIGITSGSYPARDNSGRRVLSAQQVVDAVGHRVPGSRIDRLRAPRNALLDHERSAQTGAPRSSLRSLTVDGGPSPRSITDLPDRTSSRISRSRASNSPLMRRSAGRVPDVPAYTRPGSPGPPVAPFVALSADPSDIHLSRRIVLIDLRRIHVVASL
jgi:hypothetical protein